jgi:hypothetical protein
LPKAGKVMDHRDDLLSQRAASNTKLSCKTEKQTANCNQTHTVEGVGGTLNLPGERGQSKEVNSQCQTHSEKNTVKSQLPKQDK